MCLLGWRHDHRSRPRRGSIALRRCLQLKWLHINARFGDWDTSCFRVWYGVRYSLVELLGRSKCRLDGRVGFRETRVTSIQVRVVGGVFGDPGIRWLVLKSNMGLIQDLQSMFRFQRLVPERLSDIRNIAFGNIVAQHAWQIAVLSEPTTFE
jgi:hypothetical protein